MGNLLTRAFLLPGNTVCSYFGVTDPEGADDAPNAH